MVNIFDVHTGINSSLQIALNKGYTMLKIHAFGVGIAGVLIVERNRILCRSGLEKANGNQHYRHHDPDFQTGGRAIERKTWELLSRHETWSFNR